MSRTIRWISVLILALGAPPLVQAQQAEADANEADQSFEELEEEFDEVWGEWRKKHIAARQKGASEEEQAALRAADPTKEYVAKFQRGAERHAGTEGAIDYLIWLFRRADEHAPEATMAAFDQLMRDHLTSPEMQGIAFSLALKASRDGFPRQKALDAQRLIADNAGDPEGRAEALFWRCYLVANTDATAAEEKQVLEDLATVAEIGNADVRQRAEGLSFEMTRLQIGMPAPDIEGEDLDGVAFKLSDYKGKVVMLDFWGDW